MQVTQVRKQAIFKIADVIYPWMKSKNHHKYLLLIMIFYIDTSVWGGYFDDEFRKMTEPFINQLQAGRFNGIVSNITLNELSRAPKHVQDLIDGIDEDFLNVTTLTEEQEQLAMQYLKEGALTKKYESDAFHIAIATILRVDSLVSARRPAGILNIWLIFLE